MGKKHDFEDGTSDIIAAALEVHRTLGPGFREVEYQRALFFELKMRNMEFVREANIKVYYKGRNVGSRRVDFMFADCITEIKAKVEVEDVDFAQTLSYLRASGRKVALLLNFGAPKLEIRRLVN